MWHDKESSLLNGHECRVKICRPSPLTVTSPYKWKILAWDENPQTNKQIYSEFTLLSPQVLGPVHTLYDNFKRGQHILSAWRNVDVFHAPHERYILERDVKQQSFIKRTMMTLHSPRHFMLLPLSVVSANTHSFTEHWLLFYFNLRLCLIVSSPNFFAVYMCIIISDRFHIQLASEQRMGGLLFVCLSVCKFV